MAEIENLETFYLIWFGNSLNKGFEKELRTIINYLLLFENEQQCLKYIHSLSIDDRVILIINEKFGQQIVPQIFYLQQIISIYIYSNEKKLNEQWTKNFKKVKVVIGRQNELFRQIQTDHIERQHHQFDEILSYNIFKSKTICLNDHCIYFQILIDCLIHMKSSLNDKNEFIILCKQQYKNNPNELNIIQEFEKNYLSKRSLWWYSRHSFLYRLLNKALRMENIYLLLLLRFFIDDIKQQMEMNKSLSSIHVYRGQIMSKEELEILTNFIGNFISINSFLSTSVNREYTRSYLSSSVLSDNTEKVFFEINASPQLDEDKSFSNITYYSYFPNREEVLFMIGSIFRLVDIERDIDGIWHIQLILCSNKDHQLESIIQYKKNELDIIDTNILSFGFILEDMGKLDDAEKYYLHILNQLPEDDADVTRCYHALGEIFQKKGDYDSSLKWYNKSLEIDQQLLNIDDPNLATSYNSIAVVYSKKGDYNLALESYQKALKIWKKTSNDDHLDVAMCYNNIGIILQEKQNYFEALEYYHKALNIRQKHLPVGHPCLGQSYVCIGNIHYAVDRYDLALEHYNLSLEIFNKYLSPDHPDIAMVLRNIGLVYQGQGKLQNASLYLKKALRIYRHSLSETHSDIIQIEQIIRRISSKV